MFKYIRKNLDSVGQKIFAAAQKSGKTRNDITLVAVAKTFPEDITKAAISFGTTDIGESRIQDCESKILNLGKICRWHMIGHLQSNKVIKAVRLFDMIQSVDSIKLAEEINKRAGNIEKRIDCLIEVNSSGESAKYGFEPDETISAIKAIGKMENIKLRGLMTIGPLTDNLEKIRQAFRITRALFDQGRVIVGEQFDTLSMGMTSDFEVAIEEGSTMVRIGTAIFGQRS